MKNYEKYKTVEERSEAFSNFCHNSSCGRTCNNCSIGEYAGNGCRFAWLELEAEEVEKPLPCPFCGSETFYSNDRGIIYCKVCEYRSNKYKWSHEAIAAHNRVALAVIAANDRTRGE